MKHVNLHVHGCIMGENMHHDTLKGLRSINIGVSVMNAQQIHRLLDAGVTIEVTREDGITERYDHTKDGKVAVSFTGGAVCKYCGHKLAADSNCRCDKAFEVISLTGCYRHINSVAKRVGETAYDPSINKLYINEKGTIAC